MKKKLTSLFLLAFLIFAGACDKVSNNDLNNGRLIIKVTDGPFDIDRIESATVTITKVEIRKAGEGDADDYPFIVLSEDTVTYDLLQRRNGVSEELVDLEVPKGEYDLIRLYVEEAGLLLKEYDTSFKVKVPSGKETGIKVFIDPHLKVDGGLVSELLLDFDLSKSFKIRGNLRHPEEMNGFIFTPVIRAVNLTNAGRIEGLVTDTANVNIKNANVWVKQDTVIATAYTDTLGFFGFLGIPAGAYSICAWKEGYDTVCYDEIKVIEGNKTVQNFILQQK
jgi:hypothetical protein